MVTNHLFANKLQIYYFKGLDKIPFYFSLIRNISKDFTKDEMKKIVLHMIFQWIMV